MNNKPSQSAEMIGVFVNDLKKKFPGIAIEKVAERFTSVIASRAMLNGGLKKKDRQNKALIDKISATLILQAYLERRDETGRDVQIGRPYLFRLK